MLGVFGVTLQFWYRRLLVSFKVLGPVILCSMSFGIGRIRSSHS